MWDKKKKKKRKESQSPRPDSPPWRQEREIHLYIWPSNTQGETYTEVSATQISNTCFGEDLQSRQEEEISFLILEDHCPLMNSTLEDT